MLDQDELERMAVFGSVYGLMRFDSARVAAAVRSGTLSPMEANGLANLLEGKHPRGLRLVLQGQGKGWKPLIESAQHYERVMAIGAFVLNARKNGLTAEQAVIDAAEQFNLSEPTVWRDLNIYKMEEASTDD